MKKIKAINPPASQMPHFSAALKQWSKEVGDAILGALEPSSLTAVVESAYGRELIKTHERVLDDVDAYVAGNGGAVSIRVITLCSEGGKNFPLSRLVADYIEETHDDDCPESVTEAEAMARNFDALARKLHQHAAALRKAINASEAHTSVINGEPPSAPEMIPKNSRFKCPHCKCLKRRPGKCEHCGRLPTARELRGEKFNQQSEL